MVIDRIHLGPVVFAKTLVASIAARQKAPPACNGSGVNHGVWHATERDVLRHSDLSAARGRRYRMRIVDDVVSVIKGSLQLWPTLVEICYFQKGRKGLPRTKVNNR